MKIPDQSPYDIYYTKLANKLLDWFLATFVTMHKELYSHYLPFYDVNEEEYLLDEINPQDVSFLLWAGARYTVPSMAVN